MSSEKIKNDKYKLRRFLKIISFFAFSIILFVLWFVFIFQNTLNLLGFENQIYDYEFKDDAEEGELYYDEKKYFGPLYFASFSDPLYNSAAIASLKNARFDYKTAAISLEPDYDWSDFSLNGISNSLEYFSENKKCLSFGCLEIKDKSLYFDGKPLKLPTLASTGHLATLSIGSTDNKFLIGLSLKESEEKYHGLVYFFDGQNFSQILKDEKISSSQVDFFGFGGIDSDFLIIYGSSPGRAWRLLNNEVKDISKFFDYRVMGKGFKSEILRIVNPSGRADFYIFSLSPHNPKLLKVWENPGEEKALSGIIDLTDTLSLKGEKIIFYSWSNIMPEYNNKIERANFLLADLGSGVFRLFKDYGFKNENRAEIISKPIPSYKELFKFQVKEILEAGPVFDSASDKLKNDSAFRFYIKEVFDTKLEQETFLNSLVDKDLEKSLWSEFNTEDPLNTFSGNDLEKLRLKVVFPVFDDKFASPFLEAWNFKFNYSR